MAKHNPGDILTSDWNPIVGCHRYSAGCRDCWWLDGIMPWQIRLGNLPQSVTEGEPTELEARFDPAKLRPKKGIVGVVQHEAAVAAEAVVAAVAQVGVGRQVVPARLPRRQPRRRDAGQQRQRVGVDDGKAGVGQVGETAGVLLRVTPALVLGLGWRLLVPFAQGYPALFFETNTALIMLFVIGGCLVELHRLPPVCPVQPHERRYRFVRRGQ